MLRIVVASFFVSASVVSIVGAARHQAPAAPLTDRVDFARDIQPIFRTYCYDCHGPETQMNGLRLDRRRDAMRGGTLPVIAPGSAASSRIYLRLTGTAFGRQMPTEGTRPTPEEIGTIRAWLDQGAVWPDRDSGDISVTPPDPVGEAALNALRHGDRAGFSAALDHVPAGRIPRAAGGTTPLMMATLYGDAALMRRLLDDGADPNAANDAGATALMWAVGDAAKTRLLLEHKADANARSAAGRTPLMAAAAIRGNSDVVAMLIDKGANVTATAPGLVTPMTPLTEAAKQGDEAMMRLLIARGADIARAGFQAFQFAMRSGCVACAELVLNGLPAAQMTPAMSLLSPPRGRALGIAPLLERGADARGRSPVGFPLIVLAAGSEDAPVETVRALLAHGADINAAGPQGETALTMAKRHGHTPLVDVLSAAGGIDPVPAHVAPAPAPPAGIEQAIARSLPLLQRSDVAFMKTAGCVSCHNNVQTAQTVALARSHGIGVDESIAASQREKIVAYVRDWSDKALQGEGIPGDADTVGSIMEGLAAERVPADFSTDAMTRFVRLQQSPDGRWLSFAFRPPLGGSDIKTTVEGLDTLRFYPAPQEAALDAQRIRAAGTWLESAPAQTTQDRAYKLIGLHDVGAGKATLGAAARALVSLQRSDGGWAQLPSMTSDAYATGESLVALLATGTRRPSDPDIKRGVRYLLQTQQADGSWFVGRRAIPLQPYFDAGFPYDRDQFISASATNWATQALIYASGGRQSRAMPH